MTRPWIGPRAAARVRAPAPRGRVYHPRSISAMDSTWTDCGDTNLLGCGMGARLYCVQVAP